jgi:hypothetical protein
LATSRAATAHLFPATLACGRPSPQGPHLYCRARCARAWRRSGRSRLRSDCVQRGRPFQLTFPAHDGPAAAVVHTRQRATGDVAPTTRRPQLELMRFPGPGKRSSSISISCRQARRSGVRCAPRTARSCSPAFCSLFSILPAHNAHANALPARLSREGGVPTALLVMHSAAVRIWPPIGIGLYINFSSRMFRTL